MLQMAHSIKTGHVGLILLFCILICIFVAILILSAPHSSFNQVTSENRQKSTSLTGSENTNETTIPGDINFVHSKPDMEKISFQ